MMQRDNSREREVGFTLNSYGSFWRREKERERERERREREREKDRETERESANSGTM